MTAPSAWTMEKVMAIAQATAARLAADGVVDTDAAALFEECPDAETVLVRLLRAMGEAKADAAALDQRIADLEARRDRYQRHVEEHRRAVLGVMSALDVQKFRHPEFTVSLAVGKPGVVVTDPAAVPDDFVRITRTPDKTAIGAAIASGATVPGAEVTNGMPVLTIRTK
jgi:hypothetical protein